MVSVLNIMHPFRLRLHITVFVFQNENYNILFSDTAGQCGKSSNNGGSRIVGGANSKIAAWPWTVCPLRTLVHPTNIKGVYKLSFQFQKFNKLLFLFGLVCFLLGYFISGNTSKFF